MPAAAVKTSAARAFSRSPRDHRSTERMQRGGGAWQISFFINIINKLKKKKHNNEDADYYSY